MPIDTGRTNLIVIILIIRDILFPRIFKTLDCVFIAILLQKIFTFSFPRHDKHNSLSFKVSTNTISKPDQIILTFKFEIFHGTIINMVSLSRNKLFLILILILAHSNDFCKIV